MNKIILPLDNKPIQESLDIAKMTSGLVWGYKLRRQILDKGINIISAFKEYGNVMVDFKLYDIPSAMTESLEMHQEAGADISTIHCTSVYYPPGTVPADNNNIATVSHLNNMIAGVTILTSMTEDDHAMFYEVTDGRGDTRYEIKDTINNMADFADKWCYGNIVCSPKDVHTISKLGLRRICPGIRPLWYQVNDDQNRTMTPTGAIKAGADLLVIGRPLLRTDNIVDAIKRTNEEIEDVS